MVELDKYAKVGDYTPGKLLLHGRLQAGLTLEQVAKELYMTVSKVNALENDNYGAVNSHTFARGYIRAYANLLKLDVVVLLAAYDKHIANLIPSDNDLQPGSSTATAKKMPAKSKGAWHFFVFIIIFFVGLWLISVWFLDNHPEVEYVLPAVNSSNMTHQGSSVVPTLSQSGTIQVVDTQEDTRSGSISSSAIVQQQVLSTAQNTSSVNTVAMTSSIASESVADKAVMQSASIALSSSSKAQAEIKKDALDEITFSFRAESWLEVSDSRGDVLATELEAAGSKLSLVGKAPFDVKLGNAPAVDVQLNGKKIEVIPLLGTNVLILKVSN